MARWVNVGLAVSKDAEGFGEDFTSFSFTFACAAPVTSKEDEEEDFVRFLFPPTFFLPLFSIVQIPFGPLKSGIPASVLTPAPVRITTCFEDLMREIIFDILFSSDRLLSVNSGKPHTPLFGYFDNLPA